MSFGSGGFGGFGQSNNQQSSGFGGFGASSNNSASGFGANNNSQSTFGSNANTGSGGMFGGGNFGGGNTSSGGFGSTNTNPTFGSGSKPATSFGANTATSGGGLFGTNNQQSGASGFSGGFGNNASNTSGSGFGGGSGGLFGNKSFGQTNTAGSGSSLFGGGTTTNTNTNNTTSTGFGGFGASNNPGIGGNVGDPPGTNTSPFQAHSEKEPAGTGNQTNSFQNILFQDPYKKWSAEELRLTDYNQGRRYGNASGAGAFGVSNFGSSGFGANNQQQQQQSSSTFGANNTSGGGLFGSTGNNTSGFGSGGSGGGFGSNNSGGGLFGNQNKPATSGGLFGNNTSTSQPPQSGGLFGGGSSGGGFGASNTSGGGLFGSNTNTSSNTGGGLFGASNASNTPNKPGGFSFGNNAGTTGSSFGSGNTGSAFGGANTGTSNTGGGGLFGGSAQSGSTGLFGGNQQTQPQGAGTGGFGGGAFGSQNQQSGGSSLFGGANSQKPAGGLFGNTGGNSSSSAAAGGGGGLFGGATNNTTNSSGTFGNNANASTGGGLFGQKPATTSTGLFGANNTNQTTNNTSGGGGLFGGGFGSNNSNQQQPAQGLFQSGGQNQAKPGLFGASQQSGGGLFGSQSNQQQSTLFNNQGTMSQQQPQGSIMGGSLLGNSQSMAAPSQQSLTANITDMSAYGNPSLFSNLGGNETPNPGPLATPLSSKPKTRRNSILPMYKLTPASASRFATPQKRGFGFSYSTYGSPGSPSSVASTPGSTGRSMLGSSLNRGLSKSVSSSSLRKSFSAEDSILAPGAFSASSAPRHYGNTGSVRKLIINKDMRSDLFATPTKDKSGGDQANETRKLSKRVSFDTSTAEPIEDGQTNGDMRTPAPAVKEKEQDSQTPASVLSSSGEGDQARGKELAIVHEEDAFPQTPRVRSEGLDRAPGEYWMSPTRDAISSMNRMQRQRVDNFTVGRDNVGYVSFKVPVDLNNIDLDDIFSNIIVLETRSATVYPNPAKKPPVGKGLNVPALICLEQSWPRGRDKRPTLDGRRLHKHVERLKRIPDTAFVDYDTDTGIWKFTVEHFTTYGLDYDEEDTEVDQLPDAQEETRPDSTPHSQPFVAENVADEAFEFRRKRQALPGAFDFRGDENGRKRPLFPESFLGGSSTGPKSHALILSADEEEMIIEDNGYGVSDCEDEAGPPVGQHPAVEHSQDSPVDEPDSPVIETPGGILRARMRAMKDSATPLQLHIADGDEWTDMLRKSVSPRKRDRASAKMHGDPKTHPKDELVSGTANRAVSDGRGFATSIDLMNSLFDKAKMSVAAKDPTPSLSGFVQWPYDRQKKNFGDFDLSDHDRAFHQSVKPSWGSSGAMILPEVSNALARTISPAKADILSLRARIPHDEQNAVCLLTFTSEASARALTNQIERTHFRLVDGVPTVSLQAGSLKDMFRGQDVSNAANAHEKLVWSLASILFDEVETHDSTTESKIRKGHLSHFWANLVDHSSSRSVALAKSSEEKALAALSGNRVEEACKHLVDGRDFRLATLVSLIGSCQRSKNDMRIQLAEWNDNNVLAEFTDSTRAIYELLSGNVCVCEGRKGVPVADRIESFVIANRFGLDWKQAFGLRLWYAISHDDDIAAAVHKFEEDIAQDREATPRSWYLEQGIPALWDDRDAHVRQDLLWGLLQLYTNIEADMESILRPENYQLSPLDSRLGWQLGRALMATKKVAFVGDSSGKADAATLSLADQLTIEESWLEATFVLLHLSNPGARARAVKDYLCRHAKHLGPDNAEAFATLTKTFFIPSPWIWEAQALYMRSVRKDPVAEVRCLLRAGSYEAAHKTLVESVAPLAIVGRDYTGLAKLLAEFESRQDRVAGWMLGGELYRCFLTLCQHHERREQAPSDTLETLLQGLPAMREAADNSEMTSMAAMSEMSSIVAKAAVRHAERHPRDMSRLMALPLTEDVHLRHSLQLGLSYYQGIMAGGR